MIGDGDIEAIFENGDFDTSAVFTTSAGSLTVSGWFTSASDATTIYGVEIEAQKPTFVAPTSAIGAVKNKNPVAINAVNYIVERVEKVGTGVSVCYLKT